MNDKQSFSFIGVYAYPCYTVWCTVQALYIGGLHRAPVSPVWLGKNKVLS